MLLAIDPGSTESAYVWLNDDGALTGFGKVPNDELLEICRSLRDMGTLPHPPIVVIEKIASYGMAVGAETFETVYWSGRFSEAAIRGGFPVHRIPRLEVKLQICRDSKAKDDNIRQALIDRWGGKAATKKGGALYGVSYDVWAALAVGVTYIENWLEVNEGAPREAASALSKVPR